MTVKIIQFYFILILLLFSNLTCPQDSLKSYIIPGSSDIGIFRGINNSRCGYFNAMIPITDKSAFPASIIIPFGFGFYSRLNKNYYDENSAILTGLSEGTGTGISLTLKNIFKRERPFRELKNVYYDDKNSPTDRYSFPSGHTTITFAMATALTLRYPDKPFLIAGLYLYSSVVAYGRIYLGVHYPSDVLGGMLVGSGSAVLIYSLRKQIIDFKNTLFNEKGYEDINQKAINTASILLSLAGTDLLNFIFSSTKTKMCNSMKFYYSSSGNFNTLKMNYIF